jgi:hypothetical protein
MISSYAATRFDAITIVTVVSSLTSPVYYHWFVDGAWVGVTRDDPSYALRVPPGEQRRVECVDTNDADADPATLAPADQAPATRLLWWIRSLATDLDHYRVEQQAAGGDWELLATVAHDARAWSYEHRTERLADLTAYAWRVVPVDRAGNQGTPVATEAETIVRTPDAPIFAVAFDPDTDTVTFTEDFSS